MTVSDLNPEISIQSTDLESADSNEIHSYLSDLDRETSNLKMACFISFQLFVRVKRL